MPIGARSQPQALTPPSHVGVMARPTRAYLNGISSSPNPLVWGDVVWHVLCKPILFNDLLNMRFCAHFNFILTSFVHSHALDFMRWRFKITSASSLIPLLRNPPQPWTTVPRYKTLLIYCLIVPIYATCTCTTTMNIWHFCGKSKTVDGRFSQLIWIGIQCVHQLYSEMIWSSMKDNKVNLSKVLNFIHVYMLKLLKLLV